ncbi:hypothetical protein [Sandarakinorhabdus sp. DWP1-3-1]|uniref:hypothetical protein n=1 Tax=Sandarakinorhabdus sp. DWP1-3-1 TaxID=2804627 RepID=UPI003CF7EF77
MVEAVRNSGFQSNLRNWYRVSLARKDGSLFAFEGKEVLTVAGDWTSPPWEKLILWEDRAGGNVAGRGWARHGDPKRPMIWKVGRPETVGEAMAVWGWTALAHEMAERMKCRVPHEEPPGE